MVSCEQSSPDCQRHEDMASSLGIHCVVYVRNSSMMPTFYLQTPKLQLIQALAPHSQHRAEAKRRLDAAHVVLLPVGLGGLLLANGHALPLHPHHGHSINIVLVEPD